MKNASTLFLAALDNHHPRDACEATYLHIVRTFVAAQCEAFWQRTTPQGHVTGSAFVINAARTHTLLLHHAKLNIWVQPGGHLDQSDASPAAGAIREAIEETGILSLTLATDRLFDVDVHQIPERNKNGICEPAHYHFDARYLVVAEQDNVEISAESLGFRWVALTELAAGKNESGLVRMAKKVLVM